MCRMVGLSFQANGMPLVEKVLNAFLEASRHDFYLRRIAGDERHRHGYGYAAVLKRHNAWTVLHERFDAEPAMSGEEACKANLEALKYAVNRFLNVLGEFTESVFMFHSRRTRYEPRGSAAAHPFREELVLNVEGKIKRAELYICHNGGVDKNRIALDIGLPNPELYTDSHVFLKLLTRRAEGVEYNYFPNVLQKTILYTISNDYVRSALDILVLLNSDKEEPMLLAGAFVSKKHNLDEWKYYEPVLFKTPTVSGYISSTVRDILRKEGLNIQFSDGREGYVAVLGPRSMDIQFLNPP